MQGNNQILHYKYHLNSFLAWLAHTGNFRISAVASCIAHSFLTVMIICRYLTLYIIFIESAFSYGYISCILE